VQRDRVKKLEQECFATYVRRIEDNICKDPKQFWSYIKSRSSSHGVPSSLKYGDRLVNTAADICEAFSAYFHSTFSAPSTMQNAPIDAAGGRSPIAHLSNIEVNPELLTKLLLQLDPSKSAGPDNVPALFLINCTKSIVEPIVLLFNRSFAECTVPSIWKSAFITPVHKKGSKTEVTNYRPISKLCILSKLLEKLVYIQVNEALKNYFSPNQHGFLQHRSTISNLSLLNDYVSFEMSRGSQVDVIYTDYSKAFDRIDHDLLISKLHKMGISGDLLRWFSSYIANRSQAVVINNYISSWVTVPSGVPQGSLLGPLLFNIYVNDISDCFIHTNLLCFADDMKIFAKVKTVQDSILIQDDLMRLDRYCYSNKLELNPSKCFTVTFSRQRCPVQTSYKLRDQNLSKVPVMKDLGVLHDSKLLFDEHINNVVSSATKALGFIMRNSLYFTQAKTMKVLFCAYVRSKLEYASQIWNPQYQTYIDRIERVQKKFVKYLCFKLKTPYKSSEYDHICKKHHLLPLSTRRDLADITFILNIINGNVDSSDLLAKLSFNVPSRTKRHYPPLSIPFAPCKYRQNSFLIRGCKKINELTKDIDIDIFNSNIPAVRRKLTRSYFE
jgi:hypothetical protein